MLNPLFLLVSCAKHIFILAFCMHRDFFFIFSCLFALCMLSQTFDIVLYFVCRLNLWFQFVVWVIVVHASSNTVCIEFLLLIPLKWIFHRIWGNKPTTRFEMKWHWFKRIFYSRKINVDMNPTFFSSFSGLCSILVKWSILLQNTWKNNNIEII